MFVNKYTPKKCRDILGNKTAVKKIKQYLLNKNYEKALLISGKYGVGKTSGVYAICNELQYKVIEFNSSNSSSIRKKKPLNNNFILQKSIILIDEVDTISCKKELIKYIKASKHPIICICNDKTKVKTLSKYCIEIKFRKSLNTTILKKIKYINEKEKLNYNLKDLQNIVNYGNGDIRKTIHLLQYGGNLSDKFLGIWNVLPKIFSKNISIRKGLEYYFVDYSLISAMVQENYLNYNTNTVYNISNAAESIADSDLINTKIKKNQLWELLPYHGVLSCLKPINNLNNTSGSRFRFPKKIKNKLINKLTLQFLISS